MVINSMLHCALFQIRPSRFLWTIEWLFPEMEASRRILEHKNEESKTLKDILAGTLSKAENKDVAGKYPLEQLDQCRLYFVIPLRHVRLMRTKSNVRLGDFWTTFIERNNLHSHL